MHWRACNRIVRCKTDSLLVCCLVCLPAMVAPYQLLRFEARLVLDSGSSRLLHTQAASNNLSPEIGGSRVFEENFLEGSIGLLEKLYVRGNLCRDYEFVVEVGTF